MANVNKGTSAAEGDEGVTNISEAHADQEQKDHSDEVSHQQQQKQVSSTSVSIMPSANYENDQCVEVVGKLSYLTKYIQQCQELVDHVQSCDVLNVVNVLNQAMEIATGIRDTAIQTVERCQTIRQSMSATSAVAETSMSDSLIDHDPGKRPGVLTENQKKYPCELGPFQPKLHVFPQNSNIKLTKQCRFSANWYNE